MAKISYSAPFPRQRNYKQRCLIHDEVNRLEASWKEALDSYDETDNDTDEERLSCLIGQLLNRMQDLRKAENALLLPESNNGWFRSFASSFPDKASQTISRKQAEVFIRYGTLTEQGRLANTYQCRNAGKLFTITTSSRASYLSVETLATL